MKVRLFHKILLSIFTASLAAMISIMVFTHISFKWEFLDYLAEREQEHMQQLLPLLAAHYQEFGNWNSLAADRREWHEILRSGRLDRPAPPGFRGPPGRPDHKPRPRHAKQDGRPPRRPPPGNDPMQFRARIYLLDQQRHVVVGGRRLDLSESSTELPVTVNNRTVGWLGAMPLTEITTPEEQALLRSRLRTLMIAGSVSLVLIVALSLWLARHLSAPIGRLAEATSRITRGRLQTRVTPHGADELAELAEDFNEMAATLERHDQERQRWVSDIAHELRTPLAVLRGEIEALQDKIRNPDENALASLHAEVQQLSALVADLSTLAKSDSGSLVYAMQPVHLNKLLQEIVDGFHNRFNERDVVLNIYDCADECWIAGDEIRLRQLTHNLLENSLRYTDTGGRTEIQLQQREDRVVLTVNDSAPGVPDESLPKLFDRLYRADNSRSRNTGGSGLGLAIAKSIVDAHDGVIRAAHSPLGGLSIEVSLPLDQERADG